MYVITPVQYCAEKTLLVSFMKMTKWKISFYGVLLIVQRELVKLQTGKIPNSPGSELAVDIICSMLEIVIAQLF